MALTRKEEVLKILRCAKNDDTEGAHCDADAALIWFIADPDITKAYAAVSKWYS